MSVVNPEEDQVIDPRPDTPEVPDVSDPPAVFTPARSVLVDSMETCQKTGLTQLAVRLQIRADVKSMTYHRSRHRAPNLPSQYSSNRQSDIGYSLIPRANA